MDTTLSKLTVLRDHIDALIKAATEPESKLPESWAELEIIDGYFITNGAKVVEFESISAGKNPSNMNIWPTRELAEAALAMSQLAQLRAKYWRQAGDWEPEWHSVYGKYCIELVKNHINTHTYRWTHKFLAFPTAEQRDHFLEHHRELIETAKPLL